MNQQVKIAALAQVGVCYCDNEAAWRLALKAGLPRRARVRTSNPVLLMSPPDGMLPEPAERFWTTERIEELSAAINSLADDIRRVIGASEFHRYGDLLIRDAFVWSYAMPWAVTLDQSDLDEPRAVVTIDYGTSAGHLNGHAQWASLMAANPHLTSLQYEPADCGIAPEAPSQSPTRRQLLAYYPLSHLEYAFWRRLWNLLPRSWSRGTLYVGIDNPGIRESLIHFARRGYAICETQRPRGAGKPIEPPQRLQALVVPLLRKYLEPWVKGGVQDALIARFFAELSKSLGGYDEASAEWKTIVASWVRRDEKPVAFLSNLIFPTAVLAAAGVLRDAGIPLVLYQHGHSRELTKHLDFNKSILEETLADLFLCFDDKANEFSSSNPHCRATIVTVGVPDLYRMNGRAIPDNECGDIGYIQTMIPVSNRASAFTLTWTDLRKEQFEADLMERCLAKLPHRVTIKPYLAPDYQGLRKSQEVIDQSGNLNLYSKAFDLRYIAGNFRVIVTSRATSTLGWCVLAGRPMVYLDLPYHYPLWDDAREALKNAVFYFDMGKPDAIDRLREFMSQSLDQIDRQWAELAEGRRRFIARYVDSGPNAYGKRAYRGIDAFLAQRTNRGTSKAEIG